MEDNMKDTIAIIIAAGASTRLRPLTNDLPKCMLEINQKPLIKHCIDNFNSNGIDRISVVTGYKAEKINFDDLDRYHNDQYLNNNVLHSLLYARPALEQAQKEKQSVIVSYSDIWFHPDVVKRLMESNGDINLMVDTDWQSAYEGRTDHPLSEAELAFFTSPGILKAIGKNSRPPMEDKCITGEFIGLFMLSPAGIEKFLNVFDIINKSLSAKSPFENAAEWQKSYITDIMQYMVSNQVLIDCVSIIGGWKEFDTEQDFNGGLPLWKN